MRLVDLPVRVYCERVAARTSAPGGGAVAALSAALAAALMEMACAYALSPKTGARQRRKLTGFRPRMRAVRERCLVLGQKDADLYAAKDMVGATRVPLDLVKECLFLRRAGSVLLKEGNQLLVSDVLLALDLARVAGEAAFVYAACNIGRTGRAAAGLGKRLARARMQWRILAEEEKKRRRAWQS